MKLTTRFSAFLVASVALIFAGISYAQSVTIVPRTLDYQGRLIPGPTSTLPADGTAWFKFALADNSGGVVWSNDGSSVDFSTPSADQPVDPIELAVAEDGYFTTTFNLAPENLLQGAVLGDLSEGLALHVWYSDDWDPQQLSGTFTKLVNGQRLNAVPFALRAGLADVAKTALVADEATTALQADTALTAQSASVATTANGLATGALTTDMVSAELASQLEKLNALDALASRLQAIEGAASPYYVALPTLSVDSFYQVEVGQVLNVPLQADFTSHMRVVGGPDGIGFASTSPFKLQWTPDESHIGQHVVTLQAENVFSSTFSQVAVNIVVSPPGMAYIPSGSFLMGRGEEGLPDEKPDQEPMHSVTLTKPFFMQRFEASQALWDSVVYAMQQDSMLSTLYTGFNTITTPSLSLFPKNRQSWTEVVVWCNMLNETDGLPPVYFLDAELTQVLRDATIDPINTAIYVDWDSIGYRLPTEAEWEYAARGALVQNKYPWGDQDPNEALVNGDNFKMTLIPAVEGLYPAFGFGLYHMSGNVREWVYDWYQEDYYTSNAVTDPAGPSQGGPNEANFGPSKVVRSSYWSAAPSYLTVYYRDYRSPGTVNSEIGFRLVRSVNSF